jgi:hypothetical protein
LVDQKLPICYNTCIETKKGIDMRTRPMTVAEFIEVLRTMPQDATIVVHDSDYGYARPTAEVDDDGEVVISVG